jgi:hypothetical protein
MNQDRFGRRRRGASESSSLAAGRDQVSQPISGTNHHPLAALGYR